MKKLIFPMALFFSISFYGQVATSPSKEIEEKVILQKFGPTINGTVVEKSLKMQKEQFKDAVVGFKSATTPVGTVIGFSIKIPGVQAAIIKGNKIDDASYQNILKIASKGDTIVIFDIKSDLKHENQSQPLLLEIY